MGNYFSCISKRTKTVDGVKIALNNFYGKAPYYDSDQNRGWKRFCAQAETNSTAMKGVVEYVSSARSVDSFMKYRWTTVACWNGEELLDDSFWDKNFCGIIYKSGEKLKVAFGEKALKIIDNMSL
jgi:hypothetical protein